MSPALSIWHSLVPGPSVGGVKGWESLICGRHRICVWQVRSAGARCRCSYRWRWARVRGQASRDLRIAVWIGVVSESQMVWEHNTITTMTNLWCVVVVNVVLYCLIHSDITKTVNKKTPHTNPWSNFIFGPHDHRNTFVIEAGWEQIESINFTYLFPPPHMQR